MNDALSRKRRHRHATMDSVSTQGAVFFYRRSAWRETTFHGHVSERHESGGAA